MQFKFRPGFEVKVMAASGQSESRDHVDLGDASFQRNSIDIVSTVRKYETSLHTVASFKSSAPP